MTLFFTLFVAGVLTILLPCILPLLPIVLGVSIGGRHPLRPLLTILGMVISFVGFTFLLLVVLSQFVELADLIRVSTYYLLLLFGVGFLTGNRALQLLGAVLGGFFFYDRGWIVMTVAQTVGATLMELGGKIASRIQRIGFRAQEQIQSELGQESLLAPFLIGLTLGLVWVPCAGPALGFAFTLVREEPGLRAASLLGAYALGTAVPLLLIGYGGQFAVRAVRSLSQCAGCIKQVAGAILILTAIGLQYRFFENAQIFLIKYTNFGDLGTRLEKKLFEEDMFEVLGEKESKESPDSAEAPPGRKEDKIPTAGISFSSFSSFPSSPVLPKLPKLIRAPELRGLGPWHNAEPLTLAELRGKVVLIDFWTYSCINCIRTLPYLRAWWERYKEKGFVIIGVHSPEFVFEKSERNVADAVKRHGLTYPIAQDNDFATWRAFANRYWPAKYLIDAEGYIRYTHFGEGEYDETELAIQSLLNEMGVNVSDEPMEGGPASQYQQQTPETYLGPRSWNALGNAHGEPIGEEIAYDPPDSFELHKYYLVGRWQLVDDERQVLRSSSGEIRILFLGSEINLVLGLEAGAKPVQAEVLVEGVRVKTFTIDHDDLYNLFTGAYGEHNVTLRLQGAGVAGYAFTFG